ncbi:caltractin (centrin), putative [Eimeria tenella]|uniref:Calmodulin n=1 Tax=Eimeria tenella TaxID=5802 RepID=U6KYG1_EIMTE|nr:caltractin (centrin), putative [Eimeria tenella]CDJ41384.1 caltractin (centrin), putative [Eimeria tenella]|eukprot:XP_013232134.1 caltractin (centrin), putative [Eimeria tenella]
MTGIQNMSSQLSPSTGMEFDASIYEGPQMKADEVIAMRTLFEACDTDGSGSIPLKELKSRLVAAGFDVRGSALSEVLCVVDSSGRRVVTFPEFMQLVTPSSDLSSPEEVLKTFKQMDSDSTGRITLRHISRALKEANFTGNMAQDLLNQADADNDGCILLHELQEVFSKQTYP